jgi:hypothetical protein
MEVHAWTRRVGLEVENRDLHGFLLVARQASEAVGKGVCDAEIHGGRFGVWRNVLPRVHPEKTALIIFIVQR